MEYNQDDNKPILVQFENGPLKNELKSTVEFQYLQSSAPQSNKRLLVASCENMLYTGNVQQKQQSLVKYYIGVVDKHTRRMENIRSVQLCTLKPKLKEEDKKEIRSTDKKSYRGDGYFGRSIWLSKTKTYRCSSEEEPKCERFS